MRAGRLLQAAFPGGCLFLHGCVMRGILHLVQEAADMNTPRERRRLLRRRLRKIARDPHVTPSDLEALRWVGPVIATKTVAE